ncbi:hypothetical protein CABS01_14028 [Colletotrichum abscissum]|uniref:Uncharacterized protein n=1 Tax=Colletotrichum abscissum TaxID=1671311 RepID=A0A9P9X0I0_9PEZI|nr:uncharacterized protein CABS01_14028 [Colletotrichum abscissum]KAI3528719.1 hypothetical protein CABS02_15031 [Colletotrichum abscissum]KAK1482330.1 hypothetical protein CABS01_14028 [Colletotrichum abscissum]
MPRRRHLDSTLKGPRIRILLADQPDYNSTIDELRRCRDGVHLRPPAGSHPAFAGLPSWLAGHAIGIRSPTPGVAHLLASHRF